MDRKFSDEVIGLGAVYVRVPSSDELVEKLKGDKEFLDTVRGDLAKKVEELEKRVKALEPEPSKELQDLSKWTGIPIEELAEKTPDELEKIAPFVLEVEATGEPIEQKIEPTTLAGYVPQGEGVSTLNGKPINEVVAAAEETFELVIPAGYHSVRGTFKGFKAKRLVLMSRAMLEYVNQSGSVRGLNDIYRTITDVCSSAFRYISSNCSYKYVFTGCKGLTAIPEKLFSGVQGSATSLFNGTFYRCTSLEGETPRIDGKKLWMIYAGNNIGYRCFFLCRDLSDYNEIPNDWK